MIGTAKRNFLTGISVCPGDPLSFSSARAASPKQRVVCVLRHAWTTKPHSSASIGKARGGSMARMFVRGGYKAIVFHRGPGVPGPPPQPPKYMHSDSDLQAGDEARAERVMQQVLVCHPDPRDSPLDVVPAMPCLQGTVAD